MAKIDRQLFRPSQAPHVIGVSRSTIYKWAHAGKITLQSFCGMTFVDMEEIRKNMTPLGDQLEDHEK